MNLFEWFGILLVVVGVMLLIIMPIMAVLSVGVGFVDWVVPILTIALGIYVKKRNKGYIR